MRFGIIQIRQYKKGETKIKKKVLEQIAFGIFFIIILGLIIYSVDGLLFDWAKEILGNAASVIPDKEVFKNCLLLILFINIFFIKKLI